MNKEKTYYLGYCDYNNSKQKDCLAEITWTLTDTGKFSISGAIWNPRGTDYLACGQIIEEIVFYFPEDLQAQEMFSISKDYHLNDLQAGSPNQTKALEQLKEQSDFDTRVKYLEELGLQPDKDFNHKGKAYLYGSEWLTKTIPDEIINKINTWIDNEKPKDMFSTWLACNYDFKISKERNYNNSYNTFRYTIKNLKTQANIEGYYDAGLASNSNFITLSQVLDELIRASEVKQSNFTLLEYCEIFDWEISDPRAKSCYKSCLEAFDNIIALGLGELIGNDSLPKQIKM